MRCRTCEYCLWNIASRQCPECGTPFAPSTFEFRPGAVTFCCPHCDQGYYGTTPTGQLEPRSFACVSCGATIDVDEMILRPAPGVDDDLTEIESMPWLQRQRIGSVRAWFSTIAMAMVRPGRLVALTAAEAKRGGQAWWFATISNTLYLTVGWGLIFALPMIAGAAGAGATGGVAMQILAGLLAMAGYVAAVVATVLLLLFLWGAVTHGILRLTGRVTHPLRRTCESLCYASGANVLTAVPCLGPWFGWIWPVVSGILAVREGQQVGGGRATLAVLTFPLTLFGGGLVAYFAFVFIMITQISAIAPQGNQLQITMAGAALEGYAATHNNEWPPHAAQLVAAGWPLQQTPSLPAEDGSSYLPGTTTTEADLAAMTSSDAQRTAEQVQATLPDDIVAHRLGRFVFTYHGLTRPPQHGNLWVMVLLPPPRVPGTAAGPGFFTVQKADGNSQAFPTALYPTELDGQNKLRAEVGLPPLPDLTGLTVNQPARASAATAEQPDP